MFRKLFLLPVLLFALCTQVFAADPSGLLPAEEAFRPTMTVGDHQAAVTFRIADGYYLYRDKISAATQPDGILSGPVFAAGGKIKNDEFFGRQTVYYRQAEAALPYKNGNLPAEPFTLTLSYQGCADAGVCYPPVETQFHINRQGVFVPDNAKPSAADRFLNPPVSDTHSAPAALPAAPPVSADDPFRLSREAAGANLLAFFLAGLLLSLTACLYPLLPIISAIIAGDRHPGKRRSFLLALAYTQGLALTYAAVGITAGLTGALLTVWLQQRWVVLASAAILVLLALSMFGLFSLQLPASWQSYFQKRSSRLRGGYFFSVFGMGMFSALIVGPCVAPPLAFALGYIGQTGDALLGGMALYALALGMGIPLIAAAVFGGYILPRAGAWMNAVRYGFAFLLLAAALYIVTPFLPYAATASGYTLLLLVPAALLARAAYRAAGRQRAAAGIAAMVLAASGLYFAAACATHRLTAAHKLLNLYPRDSGHFGRSFFHPDDLDAAVKQAFAKQPGKPVLVDFYADWCVSCKEMAAKTFSDKRVQATLDERRFLQIDVTANTPAQRAALKDYGLYGPPGLFVVYADGSRSKPLLGYAPPEDFLHWYKSNNRPQPQ